jgi:HEAT repeat protein
MRKIYLLLAAFSLFILGCSQDNSASSIDGFSVKNVELKDSENIESLILKLSNNNYDIRQNASNELTEMGERAVPYIIRSLKRDSYNGTGSVSFNSRWNKVNVLGRIGSNEAEDALIERVALDEETHVRWRSIWALNIVKGNETESKLLNLLKNEDEKIRWRAAVALGSMKHPASRDILVDGLNSDDSWFRWEAVYVLGILKDGTTAPEIADMIYDDSDRVRQEAALTLGKLGNKEVVPDLVHALGDKSPGVRWRAASSLAKIGDKNDISEIQIAIDNEEDKIALEYMKKSLKNIES